ncbi:MAG: hypothetical protein P4L55_00540 [Syntrophobacteraceae bacterium]|nr:hypothetical protein [Syntrophobacteraceae bacterium]
MRLGKQVRRELLKLPFVSAVAQKAGRAVAGSAIRGPNASEIEANLKCLRQPLSAGAQIRGAVDKFPGATWVVGIDLRLATFGLVDFYQSMARR